MRGSSEGRALARRALTRAAPALLAFAVGLTGCVAQSPRFDQEIQTAVARANMRRLETGELVLYYPEGTRPEVERIAARLEYCRRELEKVTPVKRWPATEKSVFVLPEVPYNNAFVAPPEAGNAQIAVIPQYATTGYFVTLGIPADAGIIGCHEMVHDMQQRQITGAGAMLNRIFGPLFTPQSGLDPWFQEGIAVYYETRLQGVGRLASKYFEGNLAAALAGTTVDGGKLSLFNRDPNFKHYLFGAHFIDFLVRTYGEKKLWELIEHQSDEVLYPFGVGGRFKSVYGRSLSTLVGDFETDLRARFPPRARPPGQVRQAELGKVATLARSASGRQAVVTQGVDQAPTLIVYETDGRELLTRHLTDLGVGRRLVRPDVNSLDGLSFTADGRQLYFVAVDPGAVFQDSRLMHLDVDANSLEVLEENLLGAGGSVSPDGSRYYFSRAFSGAWAACVYDLHTRRAQQLTRPEERHYHAAPVASPDGKRLLVTEASDAGIRLAVYDASTGTRLGDVNAPEGIAFQGSWLDNERVVYAANDGERMQVFETNLDTRRFRQLTDAPYLASLPFSDGKQLHFLNREGWIWTLDQAPYRPEAADPAHGGVPERQARTLSDADRRHQTPLDRPVRVVSDQPYSALDGLFRPTGWGPWLSQREGGQTALGVAFNGGDRLGYQRWGLAGGWDFVAKRPSGVLSYVNAMGAPYLLTLDVAHIERVERHLDDLPEAPSQPTLVRETVGGVLIGRSWFGGTAHAALGARYDDVLYEGTRDHVAFAKARFTGPTLALSHSSGESTPDSGKYLGLDLSTEASYFPRALSTESFDMTDAAGAVIVTLPLPLSKRHTLQLAARLRDLVGAPENLSLLQVGGGGDQLLPFDFNRSPPGTQSAGVLPPGLRFFEPLRGYEDYAMFGNRVAIGQATYTFPFIIDRGSASTLLVFPASFLRQIDWELFFTGASFLEARQAAAAAGTALTARLGSWILPINFRLQLAKRLAEDKALAPYLALSVGDFP